MGKNWQKTSILVTNCKRHFITLNVAVDLLLFAGLISTGRYSYKNLKKYSMKKIAQKYIQKRKISSMNLRFGDRSVETLIAFTEKRKIINKNIIQIIDCWGI